MNTELKIRELYLSGLSKKNIAADFGHSLVKRTLVGMTRSYAEIGRLYTKNITERNKHTLSQDQLDFIYGSLVGDSSLSSYGPVRGGVRKKYTIMFSNSHCDAQYGYSQYMKAILPNGNLYSRIQKSGYKVGVPVHFFSYRNKGALSDIWDIVMVDGKKKINQKWIDRLTPAAIAYWFMDDGTSCYISLKKRKSICVQFSTYSFSRQENELLKKKLSSYGIRSYVRNSEHGHTLGISKMDALKLMNLIRPIVEKIPCMQYKLKYPQ